MRVWNTAQRHGVNLYVAQGFFTALDWYELSTGEISDEALDVLMADIARRDDLQERIWMEDRP